MTDEKIITAIKNHNEDVMEMVINKYSKLLWKVTSTLLANTSEQDMEECIADVFVELWNNPSKFDPDKGKLSSWLSMTARSKAIDRYRKITKYNEISLEHLVIDEPSLNKGVLESVITSEENALLSKSIKELAPTDQDILIRRYFYNQKPKEISLALEIPKKQIENRLYLAKQTLKQKMKENGYAQV